MTYRDWDWERGRGGTRLRERGRGFEGEASFGRAGPLERRRGGGDGGFEASLRELMTRDVETVRPDDRLDYAARLMRDCDCGALPVLDERGRLIGMVTDRDITVRVVARGFDVRGARVADCMSDDVVACHVDDTLEDCLRAMARHQVRRLPVVDSRARVIGIISQADVAQHACERPGRGERRALAETICEVSEPSRSSHR
jgi:CBS domain-containing protein